MGRMKNVKHRKQLKRLLSILLSVCITAGSSMSVLAAEPETAPESSTEEVTGQQPDSIIPEQPADGAGDEAVETPPSDAPAPEENPEETNPEEGETPPTETPDDPVTLPEEELVLPQSEMPAVEQTTPDGPYKKVVIIGLDGAGAYAKNMDNVVEIKKIFGPGSGLITYSAQSMSPTISGQNWGAMFTGSTPSEHGMNNDTKSFPDIKYSSYFKVVRDAFPNANLASFASWGTNNNLYESTLDVQKGSTGDDVKARDEAIAYIGEHIAEDQQMVVFIHIDKMDHIGHGSGYGPGNPAYVSGFGSADESARADTADGYVKAIVDAVSEGGVIRDDTVVLLNADHGGNGKGHGGDTAGEKNVMFGVAGKTFRDGELMFGSTENRDVAPLVADLIGATPDPDWTGKNPLISSKNGAGQTILNIGEGAIVFAEDGVTFDGTAVAANANGYEITGVSTGNTVSVTGGEHQITLSNASIQTGVSPINITGTANVTLKLDGTNVLKASTENNAGLRVTKDAFLTIDGTDADTLTVTGARRAAGIGCNRDDNTAARGTEYAGTITINGGRITAAASDKYGAGIGGGEGAGVKLVTINGGYIVATGGIPGDPSIGAGAGIGTGGDMYEPTAVIVVNGGTVFATGQTSTKAPLKQGQEYSKQGAGLGEGQSSVSGWQWQKADVTIKTGAKVYTNYQSDATVYKNENDAVLHQTRLQVGEPNASVQVTAKEWGAGAQEHTTMSDGWLCLYLTDDTAQNITVSVGGKATEFPISANKNVLQTAAITGEPAVGKVLRASAAGKAATGTPAEATATYQWYRGEEAISGATQQQYTLTADDLGKAIKVKAVGTGIYTGEVTSDPTGATDKATPAAPSGLVSVLPTTADNTDGKITGLQAGQLYEYKLATVTEYTKVAASSTEITGLTPGNYVVRLQETEAQYVSPDTAVTVEGFAAGGVLDIGKAPITIGENTVSGKTANGSVVTIATADGNYTITGTSTANAVSVTGGKHTLTLDNVNIQRGSTPLSILNAAEVTLQLKGNTVLKATTDTNSAGVCVQPNASLTINGTDADTLTVTAKHGGAAIGGNKMENGGTIIINGGKITATAGAAGQYGAGIGGGEAGSVKLVQINGGYVVATGGKGNPTWGAGAGIGTGGDEKDAAAIIEIKGGTVFATGGTTSGAPTGTSKHGAGLGEGSGGSGNWTWQTATVTIDKAAVVFTNYQSATTVYHNTEGVEVFKTVVPCGGANAKCTAQVAADTVHSIDAYTVEGYANSSGELHLYLPNGAQKVTVGKAEYTYQDNVLTASTEDLTIFDIGKGSVTIGDGTVSGFTSRGTEVTTAAEDGNYTILGTTTSNRVSVTGGKHQITLSGASIQTGASPINITGTANVTLKLDGTNVLKAGTDNNAGLRVAKDAFLTIDGTDADTLTVTGAKRAAGIGCNRDDNTVSRGTEYAGTITINGGRITAKATSQYGAGIGGGEGAGARLITINGGYIIATGGTTPDSRIGAGAGIGTGGDMYNPTATIVVNGGTVFATGQTSTEAPLKQGGEDSRQGAGLGEGQSPKTGWKWQTADVTINGGSILTNYQSDTTKYHNASAVEVNKTVVEVGTADTQVRVNNSWNAQTDAEGKLYVYLTAEQQTLAVAGEGINKSYSVVNNVATENGGGTGEQVTPPAPAKPAEGVVQDAPSTTTGQSSYAYTYKDSTSANKVMGTVTLARQGGEQFDLNAAADASTVYTMTAQASAGYRFKNWANGTAAASMLSASLDSFAVDTAAEVISGTYAELSGYYPVFEALPAVDESAPKLSQLTMSGAEQSLLLHTGDDGKNGFDAAVLNYDIYLAIGVSEAKFDLAVGAGTVTADGKAVTLTESGETDGTKTYTGSFTVSAVTEAKDVVIVVANGGKSNTYTLHLKPVAAMPKAVIDVTDASNGAYSATVSLQNTMAREIGFELKLSDDFQGFADSAYTVLSGTDATSAIAVNNNAFTVAQATYDAANKTLRVVLDTNGSTPAVFTDKAAVATLYFKAANTVSSETLRTGFTLSAEDKNQTLTDKRFRTFGKDVFTINTPDQMAIVGYMNSLMSASVQNGVATITVKNADSSEAATAKPDAATRRFSAPVATGTYTVELKLPNYVTREISVTGSADAVIGAVAMVAGDLNGDGSVNEADRTALIAELFKSVTAGATGDIDGDGYVNGGDLGYLLANMGYTK